MVSKVALITGAGGGLGRAAVTQLASNGWKVFAADYNEQALDAVAHDPDVIPVVFDVTDPDSVRNAYETVATQTGCIDGIVNFAGISAFGSLIEITEERLRRVFDVNLFGTYRVNKTFFPLVHKAKGRIVNISSETGWQTGPPFAGPYAMTKHAIEAYSDSLQRELALVGVKVIKIQPGPFRTDMTAAIEREFTVAENESELFAPILRKLKKAAVKAAGNPHDPDLLAQVIERALTNRNPKAVYSVKPAPSRVFLEWLPRRAADRLFLAVLQRAKK